MKAWIALALFAAFVVAGCGDSSRPQGNVDSNDCSGISLGSECLDPFEVPLEFTDCIQSRAVIELGTVVYGLPQGYTNSATPTSPQRLSVSMSRCAASAAGGIGLGNASLVHVGILVEAGERDQSDGVDSYDLETVSDNPVVMQWFAAMGFPVWEGTVQVSDSMAARMVTARGPEIDYSMDSEFLPIGNGPVIVSNSLAGSLPHHSPSSWYQEERLCTQYFGTAVVHVEARQGALSQAMPDVGPLLGTSSQAILCDTALDFNSF